MTTKEQKNLWCVHLPIWDWIVHSVAPCQKDGRELHEDEVADLKAVFGTFDKNGNGEISPTELEDILKIFASSFDLSESFLHQIVEDLDADNNGKIEFNDFLELMSSLAPSTRRDSNEDQELKYAFEKIDADGSGFITMGELKDLLVKTNQFLDDFEIEDIINHFDVDKDGKLDYAEFKHMVSFSPEDGPRQPEETQNVSIHA